MIIRNKLFLIVIIFLINSCGYNPVYQNNGQNNLNIKIVKLDGDQVLNQYIKINLREYINSDSQNKFLISVKSKYTKDSLAKDLTGKTTEYNLIADINFLITKNETQTNYSISESLKMTSMSSIIDERNYEIALKESLVASISEKFITHLLTIE